MDCKVCKSRHRADKLIEDHGDDIVADGWTEEQMMNYIREHNIACPDCGAHDFTDIRQFELMFKTHMGVVSDEKSAVYLRPETAQGIFVNFKNVQRTSRKKFHLELDKSGNHSVTKLHQETLHSVHVNSNKWN